MKNLLERTRKRLEARGIEIAGPDHPIYKEGPSVVFVNRRKKRNSDKSARKPKG